MGIFGDFSHPSGFRNTSGQAEELKQEDLTEPLPVYTEWYRGLQGFL